MARKTPKSRRPATPDPYRFTDRYGPVGRMLVSGWAAGSVAGAGYGAVIGVVASSVSVNALNLGSVAAVYGFVGFSIGLVGGLVGGGILGMLAGVLSVAVFKLTSALAEPRAAQQLLVAGGAGLATMTTARGLGVSWWLTLPLTLVGTGLAALIVERFWRRYVTGGAADW